MEIEAYQSVYPLVKSEILNEGDELRRLRRNRSLLVQPNHATHAFPAPSFDGGVDHGNAERGLMPDRSEGLLALGQ